MSPSAKSGLAVWSARAGIRGDAKDSRCIDYNGRPFELGTVRVALENPQIDSRVCFKVVSTPGEGAGVFRMAGLAGMDTLAQREYPPPYAGSMAKVFVHGSVAGKSIRRGLWFMKTIFGHRRGKLLNAGGIR